MTTIGGTNKENELTYDEEKAIKMANDVRNLTATLPGVSAEAQIMKQQIEKLFTKVAHIEKLILTTQGQLTALYEARARELNMRVNGGPTSHDNIS
jgi:archaellum component FlaC